MEFHDVWQNALIACVTISVDAKQNERLLQQVVDFTERSWPDLLVEEHHVELI
jgi:uncharacterized protein YlxP (DUF503 family)